jgi:hypothetical protein
MLKTTSPVVAPPQVELPLGATEDRICGTIDIEKALTEGVKAYEPGLLVRGGRGEGVPEEEGQQVRMEKQFVVVGWG